MRSGALAALIGTFVMSFAVSSASAACFDDAATRAAHLRSLQQEFNVAALNCRSVNPADPSIAQRYNVFVTRFDRSLQSNAQTLKAHFRRTGDNLDRWMTRVANNAGQRVVRDPDYCQRASDILDQVLALDASMLEDIAVQTASYRIGVEQCAARAPTVTAQKGGSGQAGATVASRR